MLDGCACLQARQYFKVTHDAIRSTGSQHLILGVKFSGPFDRQVAQAMPECVDVASLDFYGDLKTAATDPRTLMHVRPFCPVFISVRLTPSPRSVHVQHVGPSDNHRRVLRAGDAGRRRRAVQRTQHLPAARTGDADAAHAAGAERLLPQVPGPLLNLISFGPRQSNLEV